MDNRCRIFVYPSSAEVHPARPEVHAGFETLKILVVWDHGEDRWLSVIVRNFRGDDGSERERSQAVFLRSAGNQVGTIEFARSVLAEEELRYDIIFQGEHGERSCEARVLLKPLAAGHEPESVSKSMKSGSAR